MAKRGIKTRSRDKLASFMVGTVEKAALTVALLRHSETACLDGAFGINLDGFRDVEVHGVSEQANEMFNAPMDRVQNEVDFDRNSYGVANVTAGATAAAVDYGSGQISDGASNIRNQYRTGESQE